MSGGQRFQGETEQPARRKERERERTENRPEERMEERREKGAGGGGGKCRELKVVLLAANNDFGS